MHEGTWTMSPCPHEVQAELASSLGVSELTAGVLVRRGFSDPASAGAFLAGELPPHDPFLLGDMQVACERIRAAIADGRRICVHGDYDVDGISATALAVHLLRELGAEVDWHLPSRFDEGYGVSASTLARLADEGCGLVLTVDCGITAVEEVAEAKARGLEVIVTDHHRPGDALPDCPIVATRPSDYPFPELCGTGVVYKLGQALFGVDSDIPKRHLDLVAHGDDRRRRPATRREPHDGDRRPARTRTHAEAGAAGTHARCRCRPGSDRRGRRRLPTRPADQRRRPARTSTRRAGAAAHGRPGGSARSSRISSKN